MHAQSTNHVFVTPFLSADSMNRMTGQQLVGVEDYQSEARRRLPKNALDYYQSGALDEVTLRENKEAMNRCEKRWQGDGWRVLFVFPV